jgi:hypothetical protein
LSYKLGKGAEEKGTIRLDVLLMPLSQSTTHYTRREVWKQIFANRILRGGEPK